MSRKTRITGLVAILLLALSAIAQAETPVIEWIRQWGTDGSDYGQGVSVDGNGNAYVTGYTTGNLDGNTSAGSGDMFLMKCDTDGTRLWTEQLGSTDDDCGYSVSIDSNGNVYVTGCTFGDLDGNASVGGPDIFLTKYDTDGTKLWTRQLGTTDWDIGYSVSVDGNGNTYTTGFVGGNLDGNTSHGGWDIFLTKYDTDGTKLWTEQLGSASADIGFGVTVDVSGNAYVTGYTNGSLDGCPSTGNSDMFLTKYNTNGTKQWTEQLGTASGDIGFGVAVEGNDNIYVTGYTKGSLDGNIFAGGWDMFLTKYNTNGNELWTEQLGTTSDDRSYGVSVDGSGNVYVTGETYGSLDGKPNVGRYDLFLTKYGTDGTKLWTEQLGSASHDYGFDVSIDGFGNVYVTGETDGSLGNNTNAGGGDIFLIKISTIPEPGSFVMLAGIGFMALLYRRRKHV